LLRGKSRLQFQQISRIIFHRHKPYSLWLPESSKYPPVDKSPYHELSLHDVAAASRWRTRRSLARCAWITACPAITFSSTFPHAFGVDDATHSLRLPAAGFLFIEWQHNVTPDGSIGL
jgi:hypothetical protein